MPFPVPPPLAVGVIVPAMSAPRRAATAASALTRAALGPVTRSRATLRAGDRAPNTAADAWSLERATLRTMELQSARVRFLGAELPCSPRAYLVASGCTASFTASLSGTRRPSYTPQSRLLSARRTWARITCSPASDAIRRGIVIAPMNLSSGETPNRLGCSDVSSQS